MNGLGPLHRVGPPSARQGLWLHGFLGSGSEGHRLFADWPEPRQWLCPDLPGHGERPQTHLDLGDTLEAIADLAAGCDCAAGYSLGGRLLMMAAARYPSAFSRLIVESASLGSADPEARARRRQLDAGRADDLRHRGLQAFCVDWYALPMWAGLSSPPVRTGHAEHLADALQAFSQGNQPDLLPWLSIAPQRILWLAGAEDTAYVLQAETVRRRAHRVQISLVQGAGHNVHDARPEAWRQQLLLFLQQPFQQEQ